ncbi:MAG: FkbM family methyltransferase [Gammaproteobacteria bacterium]
MKGVNMLGATFKKLVKVGLDILPTLIRCRVGEQNFWIPLEKGLGFSNIRALKREPGVGKIIKKILSEREGAVVDVGVNVGQTLLLTKGIDRDRRYVGFEPNPICCAYVEELLRKNRIGNVKLVCSGLGSESKLLELYVRDKASDVSSTTRNFRPDGFYDEARYVPVLRGDDALQSSLGEQDIALIKIDVEGGELEVIQGLQNILRTTHPPILFEVLPDKIFITNETLSEAAALFRRRRTEVLERELRAHGYAIGRVLTNGEIEEVSSLIAGKEVALSECNYLAYRPV